MAVSRCSQAWLNRNWEEILLSNVIEIAVSALFSLQQEWKSYFWDLWRPLDNFWKVSIFSATKCQSLGKIRFSSLSSYCVCKEVFGFGVLYFGGVAIVCLLVGFSEWQRGRWKGNSCVRAAVAIDRLRGIWPKCSLRSLSRASQRSMVLSLAT